MRVVRNTQMQIGEIDVSEIKFDLRSRDDIPKVLLWITAPIYERALAPESF